jgi:hypothetical protein
MLQQIRRATAAFSVMPGLDPGIHAAFRLVEAQWIAGSSPAMTL